MPSNLPSLGYAAYGNFIFSVYAQTLSFSQKPEADTAGRAIKGIRYELTIKDLLVGSTTDARVVAARATLMRWGDKLVFRDRGMGQINVNTGGYSNFDMEWGPKTQELSFKYLGGSSCEITVRFEWFTPCCTGAAGALPLVEFVYNLTWDRSPIGYTTRTFAGHIQIPATRYGGPNDRRILNSADTYLDILTPPALPGFRRLPGTAKLSEDKMKLDFTLQDVEFETNVYPPGIVEAKADFTHSSSQKGLSQWIATLKADYTIADGFDRGIAVDYFTQLIMEKIDYQRQILRKTIQPIFLSWVMGEPNVYGPPVSSFSASWSYIGSLTDAIASSGLWVPLNSSNWNKWAYSMKGTLGPRGRAGLYFSPGEDKIVEPCDTTFVLPAGRGRKYPSTGIRERFLSTYCPTPELSWYSYDCWVEITSDSGVVSLRKLPQNPPVLKGELQAGGAVGVMGIEGFLANIGKIPLAPVGNGLGKSGSLETTIQRRTGETVVIFLCGNAMRVCFPVPRPRLEKTADYEPIEDNRLDKGEGFVCAPVAAVPHTLYYAKWRLRYSVPKTYLATLNIPGNPFYMGNN